MSSVKFEVVKGSDWPLQVKLVKRRSRLAYAVGAVVLAVASAALLVPVKAHAAWHEWFDDPRATALTGQYYSDPKPVAGQPDQVVISVRSNTGKVGFITDTLVNCHDGTIHGLRDRTILDDGRVMDYDSYARSVWYLPTASNLYAQKLVAVACSAS